jgi:drug/metabolite transporter (DMT)-like permease
VLAIGLALVSSVSWGVADFLGGLKSRTLTVLTVLAVSQACGLALVAAIVLASGEPAPGGSFAVYAALASVAGLGGLAAFYRGLAVGAMSVVAPIAGSAALIPVLYGVATGERPAALQGVGIALTIAGVALAAREHPEAGSARAAAGVGLALVAAVGFGSFFVLIDEASEADALWAILANRITGVTMLAVLVAIRRPRIAVGRADLGTLAVIGALDMGANALFALASREGLVSVVSVVASLYPVVTIVLARAVLGERIRAPQLAGVAAVLAGVGLISAA